jgi:hypothetical protein
MGRKEEGESKTFKVNTCEDSQDKFLTRCFSLFQVWRPAVPHMCKYAAIEIMRSGHPSCILITVLIDLTHILCLPCLFKSITAAMVLVKIRYPIIALQGYIARRPMMFRNHLL